MPEFIVTVTRLVEEQAVLSVEAESEDALIARLDEVREAATNDFDDCWDRVKTIKVCKGAKFESSDRQFGNDDGPDIQLHPDGKITVFGD